MASTTTDVLAVVGSIGGLASAVSDAASLLTGDWFSTLQEASYGGVPFGVFEIRNSTGRQQAVHTYPIFSRMHKLGDEKRAVVILHPDDWEEWLTTSNVEAARAMLQLYPADEMMDEPMIERTKDLD
ncbi:hypothetical protein Bcep18194_B1045 [Burkholderia lata]|uniref:DNA circulation N-terminal domain-containing protein n=1 Tax=Burkholderia lata (strain ATCC 17760 / DSM 23089 / LMG 22485 / NCIMB 9086 / R18194 / 383) TaxID=482957 RepID=Q398F2_BURL3|nr:DNA circularization N-terminal domain-containing protein [Burkholderia lata]ABB11159.1 hypothetical protein Bcep18194_B1045 [Burkholderia lata]